MANLLFLKRRVRAARNISKTTRAMQMIAASKLKRGQNATLSARPYTEKLSMITQSVSQKLGGEFSHPYLEKSDVKKTLVIVISPDKGLCGGLITNLIREIVHFDSQNRDAIYLTIGKKTEMIVANLKKELVASFKFGTILPTFDIVPTITKIVDEQFLNKKIGAVKVISTNFLSVFSQKPNISTLLPVELPKPGLAPASPRLDSARLARGEQGGETISESFTLFEPVPEKLLPPLLNHFLETKIYQMLLESFASEQAARMIAMQNATDNALEIVADLKLEYNKGRQEKITNEILDIGGATFTTYE